MSATRLIRAEPKHPIIVFDNVEPEQCGSLAGPAHAFAACGVEPRGMPPTDQESPQAVEKLAFRRIEIDIVRGNVRAAIDVAMHRSAKPYHECFH